LGDTNKSARTKKSPSLLGRGKIGIATDQGDGLIVAGADLRRGVFIVKAAWRESNRLALP
jgi:hypothetical protein